LVYYAHHPRRSLFFKRDPCNVCSVPFVRDSIRFVFGRPKPSLAGPMH